MTSRIESVKMTDRIGIEVVAASWYGGPAAGSDDCRVGRQPGARHPPWTPRTATPTPPVPPGRGRRSSIAWPSQRWCSSSPGWREWASCESSHASSASPPSASWLPCWRLSRPSPGTDRLRGGRDEPAHRPRDPGRPGSLPTVHGGRSARPPVSSGWVGRPPRSTHPNAGCGSRPAARLGRDVHPTTGQVARARVITALGDESGFRRLVRVSPSSVRGDGGGGDPVGSVPGGVRRH